MQLAPSAFGYWENGSIFHPVLPPLKNPDNSKPFVVRLEGRKYVPCNVISWGENPEEAKSRVQDALVKCAMMGSDHLNRGEEIMEGIECGELQWHVEPYDINQITVVQWASNGGVCF